VGPTRHMRVARREVVTGAPERVQGPAAPASHARTAAAGLALLLAAAPLAGCSGSGGTSLNPIDWWHQMEGGRLAETRPPPPNADAPYPNLGTVPAKPPPPDKAAQAGIASGLVADRGNAHYEQSIVPLPQVRPPAGTPAATLAQGAKPADADQQPNASLPAATAPARPPPPPSVARVPVAPVSTAPLAAPAAPPAAAPDASTAPAASPAAPAAAPASQTADASMPTIPDAPPSPPQLAGAAPAVVAPTVPPVAPPPPPPVPKPNGPPVAIPFAIGSAVVPADSLAPIKLLVKTRGASSIAVTGFGEAASTDPAAQAAALPLGLDRARAVAAVLMANGVPGSAINITAEPQGSGAAARLVN